jgi:hypothetical protein
MEKAVCAILWYDIAPLNSISMILTFSDGGGIRGYSSLLILQALMKEIKKKEEELDQNIESSYHPEACQPCINNDRKKKARSRVNTGVSMADTVSSGRIRTPVSSYSGRVTKTTIHR